jgi:hypothetical protein
MRKIALSLFFLLFFTSHLHGAEPVKRQTAAEIASILLDLPYGADINQFTERLGSPINEESSYIVYRHNRTGTLLVIFKTPFNTAQGAQILEEGTSSSDAEARRILITEQFKRRYGEPVKTDDVMKMNIWSIEGLGVLAVYIVQDNPSVIIYKFEPFPGK